jgi:hypothetical protein
VGTIRNALLANPGRDPEREAESFVDIERGVAQAIRVFGDNPGDLLKRLNWNAEASPSERPRSPQPERPTNQLRSQKAEYSKPGGSRAKASARAKKR